MNQDGSLVKLVSCKRENNSIGINFSIFNSSGWMSAWWILSVFRPLIPLYLKQKLNKDFPF